MYGIYKQTLYESSNYISYFDNFVVVVVVIEVREASEISLLNGMLREYDIVFQKHSCNHNV